MAMSAIKQIERLVAQTPGAVSLGQGTPSFDLDRKIKEEVVKAILENKVDRYSSPYGILELREEICRSLKKEGMEYLPDEVIVTAGAMEALAATYLSIFKPGDEVVTHSPTYPYYFRLAKMTRTKLKPVLLNEKNGWSLNVKNLERKITKKTKAVLICNPNNPTGTHFSKEELIELAEIARKNKIYLILDNIYESIDFQPEKFNLCALKKYKNTVIRIVSFSKDFAMTGWRVGFLHSSKKNVEKIITVHDNLIYCAPVVSQYAALAALKYSQIPQEYLEEYKARRELVAQKLNSIKGDVEFELPKGGYYFFVKIKGLDDSVQFAKDLVLKAKVGVVPGKAFGPGGEGYIRICFGRSREDLEAGLNRFINYLDILKSKLSTKKELNISLST